MKCSNPDCKEYACILIPICDEKKNLLYYEGRCKAHRSITRKEKRELRNKKHA